MTAQDSGSSGPVRPIESIPSGADPTESAPAKTEREYFSREALLAKADGKSLETQDVEVPGLGWAKLTELTVAQQDVIRDSSMKPPAKKGGEPILDISSFRRKMVIESLVAPKLEASDFEILGGLGGRTFNVMQDAAMELNGVTDAAVKAAESDSGTTQS